MKLDMIRPNMFYDHSTRAIDQILANNVASLFPHIDSYEVGLNSSTGRIILIGGYIRIPNL